MCWITRTLKSGFGMSVIFQSLLASVDAEFQGAFAWAHDS